MNTLDLFSLSGKLAVVTGGEGILGKIVCETVRELGGTALSLDLPNSDITQPSTISGTQPLDILVHCAIGNQKQVRFPSQGWVEDIEIGLTGAMSMTEIFLESLKKSRGVILFIGSDLSLKAPLPYRYMPGYKPLSYSVVKHGIIGMMRYYASMLGDSGVRVNCLCPGGIGQGQPAPGCPMNRLASPDELKGPLALLMSPASSYMTGAIVSVDGGTTL